MLYDDVVVLIPGFFGFGRLGDFFYFADRVSATLRGALEARLGRAIPILSIAAEPASSLAARQRTLLAQLERVDTVLEGPARYHLVGHSAGGVDADLLTMDQPLTSGQTWDDCDSHDIRSRIRSITTISSPHYGTNLSNSAAVAFLRDPLHHLDGAGGSALLVANLAALVAKRSLTLDALAGVAQSGTATGQFLLHLAFDRDLLRDLETSRMEALRAKLVRRLFPQIVNFATCVPSTPVSSEGVPRACDQFFALLHALTGRNAPSSPTTLAAIQLLEQNPQLVVRNPSAHVASFDASSSDGVVNTARQILLPTARDLPSGGQNAEPFFGGCIVADHADVIGHYDRHDPLSLDPSGRARPINDGFFRSGAGFGDDQFFKLYASVAEWVARASQAESHAASHPPFLTLVANQ